MGVYSMLKKSNSLEINWYTDKKGVIIRENDIILFDNSHYYRCIVSNGRYCLKCLSLDLPLILLDKISVSKGLSSGIIKKSNII